MKRLFCKCIERRTCGQRAASRCLLHTKSHSKLWPKRQDLACHKTDIRRCCLTKRGRAGPCFPVVKCLGRARDETREAESKGRTDKMPLSPPNHWHATCTMLLVAFHWCVHARKPRQFRVGISHRLVTSALAVERSPRPFTSQCTLLTVHATAAKILDQLRCPCRIALAGSTDSNPGVRQGILA